MKRKLKREVNAAMTIYLHIHILSINNIVRYVIRFKAHPEYIFYFSFSPKRNIRRQWHQEPTKERSAIYLIRPRK